MNYELRYDQDAGVICLKVINMLTDKDVREIMPASEKMFEGRKRHYVLVDASEAKGILEKSARKAFREYADSMKIIEKIALWGASPVVRMMARAAAAALGKQKVIKAFTNEEEAVLWLKGDAKL
jgi:hypothetical protein